MSDAFWMALIGAIVTVCCRIISHLEHREKLRRLCDVERKVENGHVNGQVSDSGNGRH